VSDTELNLKEGKIYASVKKITGASQYLIKLPNGIAGVRGTLFSISADGTIACFESQGGGVVDVVLGKEVVLPQAVHSPDRISFAPDAPVRGMINYKPSAQQNRRLEESVHRSPHHLFPSGGLQL